MAETQTQATSASSQSASSADEVSNAGSTTTQPTDATKVDNGSVEVNGNSGSSDGSDGADSVDSGRQRSGKAERRISELTARIKELEAAKLKDTDAVAQYLTQAQSNPNLPDYTGVEEVYPSQIAKDVFSAVSKELDAKIAGTTGILQNRIAFTNAVQRNIIEAEQARNQYPVLNEANPDAYDPDLAKEIDDGFIEIFDVNPNYSYANHVKKFRSVLGRAKTNSGTTGETPQAVRQQAQAKRSTEFSKDMSLEEMKQWFASRRG